MSIDGYVLFYADILLDELEMPIPAGALSTSSNNQITCFLWSRAISWI